MKEFISDINTYPALRILDLSWNCLGYYSSAKSDDKSCIEIFAELIKKNERLLHLDISHN